MEHIIQFGVAIDDDAIERKIIEKASVEVLKPLHDRLDKAIFDRYSWGGDQFTNRAESVVHMFLNEHKEEIIDKASKYLADRLARSKKGKEILGDLSND